MKKILIFCAAVLISNLPSTAQTVSDGLSLGSGITSGTARFRGLSGAFGALGGDLSAVGVNPAGSTVFANHYASFTLDVNDTSNDGFYENTTARSGSTDFSINQAGLALVFETNDSNKSINKFALSFNYDSTRNYDDSILLRGVAANSISNFYLDNANGIALDNFQLRRGESISDLYQFLGEEPSLGFGAQQGMLGFQSFIIDPVDASDPNNINYLSNTGTGTFNQIYNAVTEGYQGKFTFNGALEIDNKLSLGLNINTHVLNKERRTSFTEINENRDALVTDVRLENILISEAAGISFQLGTIFKITPSLRLGLTYESPTWYTIDESLTQAVRTFGDNTNGFVDEFLAPNVVNVYQPYNVRSPGSVSGSLAYVFKNIGLLSIDVNSRDYSNLKFSPSNDLLFIANNRFINDELQRATTYRAGAEIKIKRAFIRGGLVHSESPYVNEQLMSDLNGFSLGLGYRWGATVLDVAYSRSEQDFSQELFATPSLNSGLVNQTLNNFIVTLGFNL